MKAKASNRNKTPDERAARARQAEEEPPPARLRDAEDDIFDVAHNEMLRHAAPTTVHLASAGASPSRPDAGGQPRVLKMDDDEHEPPPPVEAEPSPGGLSDAEHLRVAEIQAAVDATWAKANAMQEQAVEAAVRAAVAAERRRMAPEQAKALAAQEEELKLKAEVTLRQAWDSMATEKEKAVADALLAQAAT
eukprot:6842692-Prymnesium_polylepis.1